MEYVNVANIIEQERKKRQAQIFKGVDTNIIDHIEKAHEAEFQKGYTEGYVEELPENLQRFSSDIESFNKAETEFLLSKIQGELNANFNNPLLKSMKTIALNHLNTEIEKARSGIYADTAENRKLNRVGQHYGGKKKEEEPKQERNRKEEEPKQERNRKEEDNDEYSQDSFTDNAINSVKTAFQKCGILNPPSEEKLAILSNIITKNPEYAKKILSIKFPSVEVDSENDREEKEGKIEVGITNIAFSIRKTYSAPNQWNDYKETIYTDCDIYKTDGLDRSLATLSISSNDDLKEEDIKKYAPALALYNYYRNNIDYEIGRAKDVKEQNAQSEYEKSPEKVKRGERIKKEVLKEFQDEGFSPGDDYFMSQNERYYASILRKNGFQHWKDFREFASRADHSFEKKNCRKLLDKLVHKIPPYFFDKKYGKTHRDVDNLDEDYD